MPSPKVSSKGTPPSFFRGPSLPPKVSQNTFSHWFSRAAFLVLAFATYILLLLLYGPPCLSSYQNLSNLINSDQAIPQLLTQITFLIVHIITVYPDDGTASPRAWGTGMVYIGAFFQTFSYALRTPPADFDRYGLGFYKEVPMYLVMFSLAIILCGLILAFSLVAVNGQLENGGTQDFAEFVHRNLDRIGCNVFPRGSGC
ncbi:hypothetical protein V5O48_010451 [Marasmius crinis-equi]|uniref:Uncharacterized protein n=1 Tax=Marasmius crinis-equi TaxID=585013 RepID=A0ABR3F8D7_9AGAR